jgi:hypothetical protein
MRRLTRRREGERGAVTVLVAVLLGHAVLLGVAALVVDVGQIYAEREELRSGADAAATAIAKACAAGPTTCDPAHIAQTYADRNAKDGRSAVTVICGRGWNLPTCGAPAGNLTACIGAAPAAGEYVEVRTATQIGVSLVLPPVFARTFAGNQGVEGTRVAACARATVVAGWIPTAMVAPALTVEGCFWTDHTDEGAHYDGVERYLPLKGADSTSDCRGAPSNGQNGPGNFGWLDHDGDCQSSLSLTGGGYYDGDSGNNTDAACAALVDRYIDARVAMPLPLFDVYTGQGSNLRYHLRGFAAFMVTGYKFSGQSRASRLTRLNLCSGNKRCIYGYFLQARFPIIAGGGTVDYGARGPDQGKLVG